MMRLQRAMPAIALGTCLVLASCSSSGSSSCRAPIVSAGGGQTVAKSAAVRLQASAVGTSGATTWGWQLVAVPNGSAATIAAGEGGAASFTPDVAGVYVASVTVTDGCAMSAPDKLAVVAVNAPPLAVAGENRTVQPGDTVALDGSASGDADRDALTYQWSLVTRPYGSAARLAAPAQAKTSFVADVPGSYVALLTVTDGAATSSPSTVIIQAGGPGPACPGVLPVASAGPDQIVDGYYGVTLHGSPAAGAGTYTYRWVLLSAPAQSRTELGSASGDAISLWLDVPGVYLVSLVVNDGCADSAPALVKLTRRNRAPYLYAGGATQTIPYRVPYMVWTSAYDPDGDPITYAWTLSSRPAGSAATLSDATAAQPTFTPDVPGSYVLSVVASDGTLESAPATFTFDAVDQTPVAAAGADQGVAVGATVKLDGSASADPNRTPLAFAWTLVSPAGSAAVLAGAQTATPTFLPDVPGSYLATLVVSDGVASASATVRVSAWPAVARVRHGVVDAAYASALDRIVLVSADGLTLVDPRTLAETTVPLAATPTSVSVSPDGLFAAVGHAGAISHVDLSSGSVKRIPVSGSVAEVALADDGYAYALSTRTDGRVAILTVSTATGAETDALSTVAGKPAARIRPGGGLYLTGDAYSYSSSGIERYDVSAHVPVLVALGPPTAYSGACGDFWTTAAFDRIVTRCGTVLRSSSSVVDDLTLVGTLPGAAQYMSLTVRHASDSSAAGEIACITSGSGYPSWGDDTTLRRYAADGLQQLDAALFPTDAASGARWYGRYVFYRSDGSERYVLLQLDPSSGQQFGIATF